MNPIQYQVPVSFQPDPGDQRIIGFGRRPFFGGPFFGRRRFFGVWPFLGGLAGGLLAGALLSPGFYPYPYPYYPYYPYPYFY
ncbi:MAG TPA: hypothetical protein VNM69_03380 [Bacillus sp. (in: firmicutes)]|nr:hypothetical protein [Bacillus litorisediminis]HWO74944.1 hypothetical protein [Bacillus sp. (in: firmicutes)]